MILQCDGPNNSTIARARTYPKTESPGIARNRLWMLRDGFNTRVAAVRGFAVARTGSMVRHVCPGLQHLSTIGVAHGLKTFIDRFMVPL